MDFKTYQAATRARIHQSRRDLTSDNTDTIIHANTPFELRPNHPTNKACLLIHGLYDSPHTLRDIANTLVKQGIIARAILLPGHGTNPEDLLTTSLEQWQAHIRQQIALLAQEAEQISLLGFSTGGALALDYVLSEPEIPIATLILIAPALKIHAASAHLLPVLHWLGKVIPALRWLKQAPTTDYARYTRYACNGAYQAYRLTQKFNQISLDQLPPSLWIASNDDRVVSAQAIHRLFQTNMDTSKHRLLYYTTKVQPNQDNRHYRQSHYPALNILDFSHLCLCIAPTNSHWGVNGDSTPAIEHGSNNQRAPIRYGETTPRNLRNYRLIRLKYNPDFDFMAQTIHQFLTSDNSNNE